MQALAHHSLVWPGVQRGQPWVLRAAMELNPHPSGKSFWRNCDLRQLCLLLVLPTSIPGLWVLESPKAPTHSWRCQIWKTWGCSNVFSTQPQPRSQVRFWDLRQTQREW